MRFTAIEDVTRGLIRRSGYRTLAPRKGIDFSSNDYIGLANSLRLKRAVQQALEEGVPVGAGGSRLLRGNCQEHEALEEEAARFFGAQASLYFGGGYHANSALLSTLPQRGDAIFYDAFIHASAHQGMRLSKAETVQVEHNNSDACEQAIQQWRNKGGMGTPWIAVESLYSMDGDCAPLAELSTLALRYNGFLLIDEAHATGVWGKNGKGFSEELEGQEHIIVLHTCGKALGASGALVTGDKRIIDFLVNRARGFIFATAPSPLMARAVREALRMVADEPERRAALFTRLTEMQKHMQKLGFPASKTQIQPIIIGDNKLTMAYAEALQTAGFDVRGIRPPTVPPGTARLRLSLTNTISCQDIADVMATIALAVDNFK